MSKPQTEIFDITDFGAVSDRTAVNTRAIQRAIDNCSDGGIVYVPDGRFITGALYLKSNITLRIDGELFGNGDTIDYPIMKYRFEGFETECYSSLINTADSIETLKITGNGAINANGAELRKREMEENAGKPGRAVCIRSGKNISISDITIRQSPAWCLHFIYCDGVSVDNVKIHTKFDENGDRYSGIINGDGIDIDSSKNISIINSLIE
ncbi:MAG: hypothetical protein LIO59_03595, partial [Oscillospiraceae bacterium]|nr:hypothetical protein [Oscillospiraceae bacterium]